MPPVGAPRSNQGPPLRSVTTAPARSAMKPAAATSHAESPMVWLKASKRPFATYASESAAEPIVRETRISWRTRAIRRAGARPPTASAITTSDSRSLAEAWTG